MALSSGTTSILLHNTLKKLPLMFYKGIFPADEIPPLRILGKIFCIIVNTDPKTMPGSHWIGILRFRKHTKIFDSAAFPLQSFHPKIRKILRALKATQMRNFALQTPVSLACGEYCLHAIMKFHLLMLNKLPKLEKFIDKPSHKNDLICVRNIKKMKHSFQKK